MIRFLMTNQSITCHTNFSYEAPLDTVFEGWKNSTFPSQGFSFEPFKPRSFAHNELFPEPRTITETTPLDVVNEESFLASMRDATASDLYKSASCSDDEKASASCERDAINEVDEWITNGKMDYTATLDEAAAAETCLSEEQRREIDQACTNHAVKLLLDIEARAAAGVYAPYPPPAPAPVHCHVSNVTNVSVQVNDNSTNQTVNHVDASSTVTNNTIHKNDVSNVTSNISSSNNTIINQSNASRHIANNVINVSEAAATPRDSDILDLTPEECLPPIKLTKAGRSVKRPADQFKDRIIQRRSEASKQRRQSKTPPKQGTSSAPTKETDPTTATATRSRKQRSEQADVGQSKFAKVEEKAGGAE